MAYTGIIICLANSIKHDPYRCVAGKAHNPPHAWMRPVTNDRQSEGAIPRSMMICADKTEADVFDVIEVPFVQTAPRHCQTENHLVAAGAWTKRGRIGWADLPQLIDHQPDLWGTGNSSSRGMNDQITSQAAFGLHDSLRLLKPTDFVLQIREERAYGTDRTKRSMRGAFTHHGHRYLLKVTDPLFTGQIGNFAVGQNLPMNDVFITVSVSDELVTRAMHFKLIAAIITPSRR
jgi:hypothetical protein